MPATKRNDTYDALVKSIERHLRPDLASSLSGQLVGSIERIILTEARAGELRLAQLRLVVVAPYLIITTWMLLGGASGVGPGRLVWAAVLGSAWLVGGVALIVALRRGWYRVWLPHVAPLVDAGMILAGFFLWWSVDETSRRLSAQQLLAYVAALCAFLSLSGALRLSRWTARAGAILGVTVFLVAAIMSGGHPALIAGVVLTLLATGLLGASVTTLVRRVVTDEVARVTLARLFHEAEETIDAREQVLKIVSHDLRNPLHTISMSAALLLDVPQAADKQAEHLRRIKRAGERMNRLIQDLMDAAKLEAGRVGIDARRIEVAPLMIEAQEMLAPLATGKGVQLDVVGGDHLPAITADSGRVMQVLSNLGGNAIKFTPAGGRVTVRADATQGGVRFSVSDTGQGIPPDQLGKIFGRFWQANPADRRGIGLGLTIAKGIVEAHGGRIWVESRLGEGTTFYFTLASELPPTVSAPRERRRDAEGQLV